MNKCIKYFGALFMEKIEKDEWKVSIGRISWWIVFADAMYIWISSVGEKDITDHHLTVLLLLAGYNFGKKGLEVIKNKMTNNNGPG
ncbi:hypothetical protein LCGC14_1614960 [marine sediment metagenome]|uniref:Uncharacterized protein n=1 Tax=marine sediment metagenome TaxID=412755 RepID=A0A0F9I766_9ZZZZ